MGPIVARIRAEVPESERAAWDGQVKSAYASYYQKRNPGAYCK
jgi:hypothetical protein